MEKDKINVSFNNLTGREKQILRFIVQGYANKEIALKLKISRQTVETHCKNIYRKLCVNNRYDATEVADNNGFYNFPD